MPTRAVAAFALLSCLGACAAPRVTEPLGSPPSLPVRANEAPVRMEAVSSPAARDEESGRVDLEAARAMLAEGERELGLVLGQAEVTKAEADDGASRAVAVAPSTSRAKASRVRARADEDAVRGGTPERLAERDSALDRCTSACKALDSMTRAATRMCELVGESDAQCSDARNRVARSQLRVVQACPACAPGR